MAADGLEQRRIAPPYAFRFDVDTIKAAYGSFDDAFARGDFMIAAQLATDGSEHKGCALALCGLIEQGLETLERLANPSARARICQAFALWSLEQDEEAKRILGTVADADWSGKARAFRDLVNRDRITVFVTGSILSIFGEDAVDALPPERTYGAFLVKYVASQMRNNAYPYDPGQPFDEFIDALPVAERPDFIFSLSPQWLVPRNFQAVSVPKVLWCHDADAFIYRNWDNFRLYDVAISTTTQEHFEMTRGNGVFCATNLVLHPLATPLAQATAPSDKTIDVIFTGSAFHSFHSEKARFLFHLAELGDDYTIRVLDGYLPRERYFQALSHAWLVPVVNRYAGAPSPRWRDALASGAFLLFPQGTLFDEVAPGCFPYRAGFVATDVRRHLERIASGADPDYDPSRLIPEIGRRLDVHRRSHEQSFLHLLKYAAFMACVWRDGAPRGTDLRRRLVWLTPNVDSGIFGAQNVKQHIEAFARSIDGERLVDEKDWSDAAHLYAQMTLAFPLDQRVRDWTAKAERYFAEGIERYPASLVLRFNRALWRFLAPNGDHAETAREFQSLIDDFGRLTFDPRGTDIGFNNCSDPAIDIFPYADYADAVTRLLALEAEPDVRAGIPNATPPAGIVLSACHAYIGVLDMRANRRKQGLARLDRALKFHPGSLPVLTLRLNILLERAGARARPTRAEVANLAEALIAVANIYPAILLGYTAAVVPILAEGGETDAAREVLRAWHRIANIVEGDHRDWTSRAASLLCYRHLFPAALVRAIDDGLSGKRGERAPSQLECALISAARSRPHGTAPSEKSLRRLVQEALSVNGYIPRQNHLLLLQNAFAIWLTLPWKQRWIYFTRALTWAMHKNLRAAAAQTIKWSIHTKWRKQLGE